MSRQNKKKEGRPTVITERVLSELKFAFSFDCTDKEACILAGISEKTLYNYQNTHPEFLQEKEQWKSTLILKARIAVSDNLEKDPYFALRYLCKRLPNEFYTPSRSRFYTPPAEASDELRQSLERTREIIKKYGS